MDRQQQAAGRQLFTYTAKLGVQLPKPVVGASTTAEKIRNGIAAIPPHNLTGVATAVADALARGADPLTDVDVARAITLDRITGQGVFVSIEDASFTRLWEACEAHQDEIVEALRKPFDKAAASLSAAFERIGDLDLKDSDLILKKGGDIASVWAVAVDANKLIDDVVTAWMALDRFIHSGGVADRRWINLRIVDTTAETWDAADMERKTYTAWDAVRVGATLSLPTRSELDERRAAITNRRAEIQAEAVAEPKRQSYLMA